MNADTLTISCPDCGGKGREPGASRDYLPCSGSGFSRIETIVLYRIIVDLENEVETLRCTVARLIKEYGDGHANWSWEAEW